MGAAGQIVNICMLGTIATTFGRVILKVDGAGFAYCRQGHQQESSATGQEVHE